jgi:hypothetical protein
VPPEGVIGRAFLLETPIDDPGDDRRNVAKLWELAGVQGPEAEKGFSMLTPAMRKMRKEMARKGKKFASSRHLPAPNAKAKTSKVSRKKGNKTAKRKG